MARANGLDNMSYADLLTLQEKVAAAIIARKAEDAKTTKDQLRARRPGSGLRSSSASAVPKVLASPTIAILRMPPRRGRAEAVSQIGLLMP
jgi:hypothetical protein